MGARPLVGSEKPRFRHAAGRQICRSPRVGCHREPNTLFNSRWRCDHGWDIDLDDGSSNYRIYNNLCLKGGLKLREGFFRICENNVLVNNSLHAHVWFNDSHDVFRSNIPFTPYRPIRMRKWTQEIDFNLLQDPDSKSAFPAKALQALSAEDTHSLDAEAQFINAPGGDYRVKPNSPAISLGFVNFDMREFGVQAPALRAIARTPELPSAEGTRPVTLDSTRSRDAVMWEGARVRNIAGLDEVSAAGTPGETGVTVLDASPTSRGEQGRNHRRRRNPRLQQQSGEKHAGPHAVHAGSDKGIAGEHYDSPLSAGVHDQTFNPVDWRTL